MPPSIVGTGIGAPSFNHEGDDMHGIASSLGVGLLSELAGDVLPQPQRSSLGVSGGAGPSLAPGAGGSGSLPGFGGGLGASPGPNVPQCSYNSWGGAFAAPPASEEERKKKAAQLPSLGGSWSIW